MSPVALGLRAIRGGAVIVGVAINEDAPHVALSSFLATGAEDDRLSLEPYHVAAAMKRGPNGEASAEAAAAVAEGRKRQAEYATKGLEDIIGKLRGEHCAPTIAALLVNRAGWVTDLLSYSLASPDHPAVAEGLAVRDAFRIAVARVGIKLAELDEKSLPDTASAALDLAAADIDAQLRTLGASAGKQWRKEQKLACLAAWSALATSA